MNGENDIKKQLDKVLEKQEEQEKKIDRYCEKLNATIKELKGEGTLGQYTSYNDLKEEVKKNTDMRKSVEQAPRSVKFWAITISAILGIIYTLVQFGNWITKVLIK